MSEIFKNRLNQALALRDMRAVDLINKTGIAKGRISQYMKGLYEPKPQALFTIAAALNVNSEWLTGNSDVMETQTEEERLACQVQFLETFRTLYGSKAVEMLSNFSELNEIGQRKALDNLSDLLKIEQYCKKS